VTILIRFISKNAAGGVEERDRQYDTDTLTIGRATDQLLQLRDRSARLQHARIEKRGGDYHITTRAIAGVTVDSQLAAGDVIEVGANILTVITAPEGIGLALSFELNESGGKENISDWTSIESGIGGLSKRRLSWSLVIAVALGAFLLPLLLGTEQWWLAGPVHSAHTTVSSECDACHINAFERVPDIACLNCHEVTRHVTDNAHTVMGSVRCASCHLEHNEPPQLVKQQQSLCTDCHLDLPEGVMLQTAGDFLDAHPDFNVSLLQPGPAMADDWRNVHMPLANAAGQDRSNLKFDHAAHLDAGGIITPDGKRVMECTDCHVAETGGAGFQPISMDERCSSCHSLAFDPDDPSRVVPHGDAEAVVQSLVEYYSARLLGGDPAANEQRLRRPGQSLTRAERDRAAAEARSKALDVAADLFERQACSNCHDVTEVEGAEFPWRVTPVQLTPRFFAHADFSHAAHDNDPAACDGCHGASDSTAATDVLIPDIDNCRSCHGSGIARRNASGQIASTCVQCHNFHGSEKGGYP
jgi:hypothetical protein